MAGVVTPKTLPRHSGQGRTVERGRHVVETMADVQPAALRLDPDFSSDMKSSVLGMKLTSDNMEMVIKSMQTIIESSTKIPFATASSSASLAANVTVPIPSQIHGRTAPIARAQSGCWTRASDPAVEESTRELSRSGDRAAARMAPAGRGPPDHPGNRH
jgi:hypothetical protein